MHKRFYTDKTHTYVKWILFMDSMDFIHATGPVLHTVYKL